MRQIIQTDSPKPLAWLKNAALGTALAFALTACGDAGSASSAAPSAGGTAERSQYEFYDDHAIGNPNAKATIIEYASVVCGACGNWHTTVYPDFKKKYIDTGLVRFVFREFPTAPENLAEAGFKIANCAGEEKFFENISLQFKRQRQIIKALSDGTVKDEYIAIAKAGGLSEKEFEQCLQDPEESERYKKVVQMGLDAGVTGTPSFFLNGEKTKMFKLEDFDKALRPILGEEATKSDTPDEEEAAPE